MSGLHAMLETAIATQFSDVAAHSAYADLLIEEGNPHGEFIRLQLALENENTSLLERRELSTQERSWLREHQDAFFGPLSDSIRRDDRIEFGLSRGWLESIEIPELTPELANQLRNCPAARMLQSLTIAGYPAATIVRPDEREAPPSTHPLQFLVDAPFARSLRAFRLGIRPDQHSDEGNPIADWPPSSMYLVPFLESLTRLESLRLRTMNAPFETIFAMNWPHLRTLHLEFGYSIPLSVLADNESLKQLRRLWVDPEYRGYSAVGLEDIRAIASSGCFDNLKHLQLRYCDLGDRMVRTLIRGGLMRRLRTVDLRHGNITDAGVRAIVESDCSRRLQTLDLAYNLISDDGLDWLNELHCEVMAYPQSQRRDRDGVEDLYEEDFE